MARTAGDSKEPLKQYKIIFHSGEDDADSGDVVIGHNCVLNRYQRNIETTIDENFLAVLKDTVIHTKAKDANGKESMISIPRFSYSLS